MNLCLIVIENLTILITYMLEWVTGHLVTYSGYLIAPILYHCACDGYVLTFLFTLMELNDTFAGYRIYLAFILSGLLFKNYIFSVYTTTKVLLGRTSDSKILSHRGGNNNHLKLLGPQILNLVKGRFSNILKLMKSKFSN